MNNQKLRVLQIIPSVSLVYGGPSQMVLSLSAALAKEGVEVTILTTNSNGDAGQPPLDVPLDRPVEQNGYQIRYFPCSPFRRYKFSLLLLRWLNKNAKNYDLAHIHALFSPVSSCAATIARWQKLPYILRPLGTLDPADLRKKKWLKKFYITLLERPNIAGASAIHFTSLLEASISEKFGVKTQDFVIPLGVELPKLENRQSEFYSQSPVILFMSRIDPKKGLNLLIPALQNLLNRGVDFHLVLAGSNPQDPEYEAKIRSQILTALPDRVTITGFVTGDRKISLLQNADLFVLPSYYENFGIAVAEAMAAGTPVCISRGVYIWEDVLNAEAGWVFDLTVESLTDTLIAALKDKSERERRGLNAKEFTKNNYSWQTIAKETIAAYHQICH